jgi:predicted transcriptional regulator
MRKDDIEERIISIERSMRNLEINQREQGEMILSELRSFQRLFVEEKIEAMRRQVITSHQQFILHFVISTIRREFESACPDPCSLYDRGECIDFFTCRLRESAERMDPDEVDEFLACQKRIDADLITKYPELGREPCSFCFQVYSTERDRLMKAIGNLSSLHSTLRRQNHVSMIRDLPDDQVLATIIEPLSHPIRFSMIKALSRGSMSYTELSLLTGYKGGHLLFHVTRLIEAGLVGKDEPQGKYLITEKGIGLIDLIRKIYSGT